MFPERPIDLIVPFREDSASDFVARLIAARLAQTWGQDITVHNHPREGATGGVTLAARAAPDGHTLLLGTSTTHCIAPALQAQLPYDPVADFLPISLIGWAPNLLLVPQKGPDSVEALLALARERPGMLTYASTGSGRTSQFSAALLGALTGVKLAHRPYARGRTGGLQDLMANKVDLMCDSVLAALPHVRQGEVKALAVAGALRCPALPGLPTLEEAGVPGYAADLWMGLFAPARTPGTVAAQIRHDLRIVLGHTDLLHALDERGFLLDVKPGAEFAEEIADSAAQWREIIRLCQAA
ncbi:MAG: putative exported protein [Betaproteobacteria bacterium]|nr:putative exported protein [Betaproteobacteria bacterium]